MSTAVCRLVVSEGIAPGVRGGPQPRGVFSARRGGYVILRGCPAHGPPRGRYKQEAVPVGEGAMAAILMLDAGGVARACDDAAKKIDRTVTVLSVEDETGLAAGLMALRSHG